MTLAIRAANPGDAAALAALAERTFRAAFGAANRPSDMDLFVARTYGPERQLAEILDPAVTTLLGEVEGELAAYAQLRPGGGPTGEPGPAAELWRFYVDARWHGRGLAQQLMGRVIEAARARGAVTLWLGVWENNLRAQAFYRKIGFVDVGNHPFLLGTDLQTDRLMSLPLPPA